MLNRKRKNVELQETIRNLSNRLDLKKEELIEKKDEIRLLEEKKFKLSNEKDLLIKDLEEAMDKINRYEGIIEEQNMQLKVFKGEVVKKNEEEVIAKKKWRNGFYGEDN